jgi:hypothetical protein
MRTFQFEWVSEKLGVLVFAIGLRDNRFLFVLRSQCKDVYARPYSAELLENRVSLFLF